MGVSVVYPVGVTVFGSIEQSWDDFGRWFILYLMGVWVLCECVTKQGIVVSVEKSCGALHLIRPSLLR